MIADALLGYKGTLGGLADTHLLSYQHENFLIRLHRRVLLMEFYSSSVAQRNKNYKFNLVSMQK